MFNILLCFSLIVLALGVVFFLIVIAVHSYSIYSKRVNGSESAVIFFSLIACLYFATLMTILIHIV